VENIDATEFLMRLHQQRRYIEARLGGGLLEGFKTAMDAIGPIKVEFDRGAVMRKVVMDSTIYEEILQSFGRHSFREFFTGNYLESWWQGKRMAVLIVNDIIRSYDVRDGKIDPYSGMPYRNYLEAK
jgi:hypothetical protein